MSDDLRPWGYAPGEYMGTCHICHTMVLGVSKRSTSCRPCAEGLKAETLTPKHRLNLLKGRLEEVQREIAHANYTLLQAGIEAHTLEKQIDSLENTAVTVRINPPLSNL